jgi:hypothetical protein
LHVVALHATREPSAQLKEVLFSFA